MLAPVLALAGDIEQAVRYTDPLEVSGAATVNSGEVCQATTTPATHKPTEVEELGIVFSGGMSQSEVQELGGHSHGSHPEVQELGIMWIGRGS